LGKKTITVRNVDEQLWESFKLEAAHRQGRVWDIIGEELEHAIRLYLAEKGIIEPYPNSENQASASIPAIPQAVQVSSRQQVKMQALEHIKTSLIDDFGIGVKISEVVIANEIRKVLNICDDRSVNNKIKRLVAEGFLERDYEILDSKLLWIRGSLDKLKGKEEV
jgi:hypothetical protein